jgi:hypothetical protein
VKTRFQSLPFKWVNLHLYAVAAAAEAASKAAEAEAAVAAVGRYKLTHSLTHILQAPGFNPRAYELKTWFQELAFK